MGKGQISFETVSLVSFMVVILLVATTLFVTRYVDTSKDKEREILEQISSKIESEFQLARLAEEGYNRTFILPSAIGGKNVSVSLYKPTDPALSETEIVVKLDPPLDRNIQVAFLIGRRVFGSINNGSNTIIKTNQGLIVLPEKIPENAEPYVAYAYIIPDNPTMNSTVNCEFWTVNIEDYSDYNVEYEWFSQRSDIPLKSSIIFGDDIVGSSRATLDLRNIDQGSLRKGDNLSCRITLNKKEPEQTASETVHSLSSRPVTVRDHPPHLSDITTSTVTESGNTWYFSVLATARDIDIQDNDFSVSVVKEGVNSEYLKCENPASCTYNSVLRDNEIEFVLSFSYPFTVSQGNCPRLSFKLLIRNNFDNDAEEKSSNYPIDVKLC